MQISTITKNIKDVFIRFQQNYFVVSYNYYYKCLQAPIIVLPTIFFSLDGYMNH